MSSLLLLGREELGRGAEGAAGSGSEAAPRICATGTVIEAEGAPTPQARAVLGGWVGCCRVLPDGRRQIVKLVLPGEVLLTALPNGPGLCEAVALTRVRILDLGPVAAFLERGSGRDPALQKMVRAAEVADQARLITHVIRLGRMSALERMAHLLLELHQRLHLRLPRSGDSMELPITQEVLADFLGLSIVHVNRTLQQLRRDGMIEYRAGRVLFRDPQRLSAACGFAAAAPVAA